eukprot:5449809-Amphidinium_carterae.1
MMMMMMMMMMPCAARCGQRIVPADIHFSEDFTCSPPLFLSAPAMPLQSLIVAIVAHALAVIPIGICDAAF